MTVPSKFLVLFLLVPLLFFVSCRPAEIAYEGVNYPGQGSPWNFTVVNASGVSVTVKITPLTGYPEKSDEQPVDGPIVQQILAPGDQKFLQTRTGWSSAWQIRTFLFEVTGLSDRVLLAAGWPVEPSVAKNYVASGLGYLDTKEYPGYLRQLLVSSLAPNQQVLGYDISYQVTIKADQTMEWSITDQTELGPILASP